MRVPRATGITLLQRIKTRSDLMPTSGPSEPHQVSEPLTITVPWNPDRGLLPFGTPIRVLGRSYLVHGCTRRSINVGDGCILDWDHVELDLTHETGRSVGAVWLARQETNAVLAAWVAEGPEGQWYLHAAGPISLQRWRVESLEVIDARGCAPDGYLPDWSREVDVRALEGAILQRIHNGRRYDILGATVRIVDGTCPATVRAAALLDWREAMEVAPVWWPWMLNVLYSVPTPKGADYQQAARDIQETLEGPPAWRPLASLADPDLQSRLLRLHASWVTNEPADYRGGVFRRILLNHGDASFDEQLNMARNAMGRTYAGNLLSGT